MTLRIDVLTLFPDAISNYASTSVLGRAHERGIWEYRLHDFREETADVHRSVDDTPFGGGAGMVLRAEPIVRCVANNPDMPRPILAMTPSGRPFTQAFARELSSLDGFTLLCGRYEGFDQRALDLVVDEEVSVGDFVLAGGELAALVIMEAVVRLRPGALGNDDSVVEESFGSGLLEYPQYTKPADFEGRPVPDVLLSGNHALIARWRHAQALHRTLARRPDLIAARGGLTPEELAIMGEFASLEPTPPTR